MLRIAPFMLAAVVIGALTYVEGSLSDRWTANNLEAIYCAELLDQVPEQVGDWKGENNSVEGEVLQVAGARGFVSRNYVNESTGKGVAVWLIVGHARDTAEHTPDSCYPSSGFDQSQDNFRYTLDIDGDPVEFWTGMFTRSMLQGQRNERVFWTWFKPNPEGRIDWVAPDRPKFHFRTTRALYKLYFTSIAAESDEAPEESVCLEFAKEFLPELNKVLGKANDGVPEGYTPKESA